MREEPPQAGPVDRIPQVDTTTRKIPYPIDGRQQFHYIHPRTFPTPVLAAHLADKWVEVSREVPGSSSELATGVRLFLRHLGQQLHQAECLAGFGLYDVQRRHLDAWEQELRDRRQRSHTDTAYRRAVYLFALLDRIECDAPGSLHPEVVRRIEQGTRLTHLRNPGLPAYGPRELRRMRFRAHHVIHQAMQNENPQGPDRQTLIALCLLLSLSTGEPIEGD